MPRKHRVAVIGRTGRGDYGHGLDLVWRSIEDVEIVAVADENEKGRAAAAKKLGVERAYADYREMLAKEKPSLVSVAPRWLDCHRDMVLACAEHGASIFLEKPLCRTLAEADEMAAACDRHHVKLAIAHQTRYSPRMARIRELIEAGRIGDVLEIRGRGKEDARAGGEDLMVLGTHIMDMMRFLAGDARWCFARVCQEGVPVTRAQVREGNEGIGPLAGNQISALYGFDRGVMGYFSSQRHRQGPGGRFGLQIFGTKGIIQVLLTAMVLPAAYFIEDPAWTPARSKAAWQEITSAGLGKVETLKEDMNIGNGWIARDLIAAIEEDRPPKGSLLDGRAALEMILAVYESHRLKSPVELPLQNRKHPLNLL